VLALRKLLQETPQEELDEVMARVKAMNLEGPTLSEYMANNTAYQLHIAKQQLEIARTALKEISAWSLQLQQDVEEHGTAMSMWRHAGIKAGKAIQDMRNLKRR
jgi:aspartate ammonia-lyase